MTVPINSDVHPPAGESSAADEGLVLSRQRLDVATGWQVNGRLRLRRELVSETRTVEVTVRREVLSIDYQDAHDEPAGAGSVDEGSVSEPPTDRAPLVIVLREEVPQVTVMTVPYEQVTATFAWRSTERQLDEVLTREQVVFETTPGVAVAGPTDVPG